jgi:predicted nucleic acid-binding protein
MLSIRFRGTLGLLLDAKAAGLVSAVEPLLNQLQGLGFRLHSSTREAILDLAGERMSMR